MTKRHLYFWTFRLCIGSLLVLGEACGQAWALNVLGFVVALLALVLFCALISVLSGHLPEPHKTGRVLFRVSLLVDLALMFLLAALAHFWSATVWLFFIVYRVVARGSRKGNQPPEK